MPSDTNQVMRDGNGQPFLVKSRKFADGTVAFYHSEIAESYVQTILTLTAGHIAGTVPIVPAPAQDVNRRSLQFGADTNFKISLVPGATAGMRVYASARDGFNGQECPAGAIYHVPGSGLIAGATLVIWEA
jgi:hypothetical protein